MACWIAEIHTTLSSSDDVENSSLRYLFEKSSDSSVSPFFKVPELFLVAGRLGIGALLSVGRLGLVGMQAMHIMYPPPMYDTSRQARVGWDAVLG